MTPMLQGAMGDKIMEGNATTWESSRVPEVALGRLSYAEEQANVISFLLSSESSYIDGAAIVVDGGYWDIR